MKAWTCSWPQVRRIVYLRILRLLCGCKRALKRDVEPFCSLGSCGLPRDRPALESSFCFQLSAVCERKQQGLDILSSGHVPSISYKIITFLYRLRAKFFKKILKDVEYMMFKIVAGEVKTRKVLKSNILRFKGRRRYIVKYGYPGS